MSAEEELIAHMAQVMVDSVNETLKRPEYSGFTREDMSAALVAIIAGVIPEDERNPDGLAIYLYRMKKALEGRLGIKSDDYADVRKQA